MSTTNQIIAIAGAGFDLSIHPKAEAKKVEAIAFTKKILAVADAEDKDRAVAVVANAKALLKACENSRKDTKEPILKVGKEIDKLAREYAAAIETEVSRVERLISGYIQREADKVEEIRRKQREEQESLERAKREQERIEREQELAIQRVEEAKTKKEREAAEKLAQDLAKQASENADLIAAKSISAAEAEDDVINTKGDDKADGAAVKHKITVEILDIHALYAFNRDLVRCEAKLNEIKRLAESGVEEIPGVKITKELSAQVRAGTNPLNFR